MAISAESFLVALFAKVKADATISALVPAARINSHLPQDEENPCIRLRVESWGEYDTKTSDGFDAEIVADVWSDYHGDKEVLQISDALRNVLHRVPLTVTTGENFHLRYVSQSIFTETEGQLHRARVVFRALITD